MGKRKKIIMMKKKKKNKQKHCNLPVILSKRKHFLDFFAIKIKTYLSRPNIVAHFRKWSTILLKKNKRKKTRTFFVNVSFLKAKKKLLMLLCSLKSSKNLLCDYYIQVTSKKKMSQFGPKNATLSNCSRPFKYCLQLISNAA